MKLFSYIFLLLVPFISFTQIRTYSFDEIDERVKDIPFAAPEVLARELTAPYKTDIEKVRAIFRWITENIEYNVKPSRNISRKTGVAHLMDNIDDTGALKPLNERVAVGVLSKGMAFCDGYARLFTTLCDYAGIRSEVISGYANGSDRRTKFTSNHRWNAVYIAGTWHLLDVTWASGYVTYGNEFVKSFSENYWLASPEEFARDHYPEELGWTLLSRPPDLNEFNFSPFKTQAFARYHLSSYTPAEGVIEASVGDTLEFDFQTLGKPRLIEVIGATSLDVDCISLMPLMDSLRSRFKIEADTAKVTHVVGYPTTEWLNVLYNHEVVLRYKLNIMKSVVKKE